VGERSGSRVRARYACALGRKRAAPDVRTDNHTPWRTGAQVVSPEEAVSGGLSRLP
jgi:hypothetical protein